MKNSNCILFLAIFCTYLFYPIYVNGQISKRDAPASFKKNIPSGKIPQIILPPIDMGEIKRQDEKDNVEGLPPRFGYPHEVTLNLENSGVWQEIENGRIWRLTIVCPNAKSVNLLYDNFWIPEGARFHIYNKEKTHTIGGFSNRNNKGTKERPGKFGTGLVYGSKVTLEYFEPKDVLGEGIISIARVIHGYRFINILNNLEQQESFGDSGNCQVNINCSEGDNWQEEKRGVALILVNGNRYCTGSLINTTRGDGTPYFLTADHCLGGWANSVKHDAIDAPDLSHWSFYWDYESPDCNNGSDFTPPSTIGATVIANNYDSDFALLELTENPIDLGINPFFNGWDRSSSPGTNGVGIHHPSGDIKKIATHHMQPLASSTLSGSRPDDYFWQIQWSGTTNGFSVTEGGSSGSPLFNKNSHIIGQLFGGSSINCSDPANDPGVYGKIYSSWNANPNESRRRLSDWLDPDNTGVTTLDGIASDDLGVSVATLPSTITGDYNGDGKTDLFVRGLNKIRSMYLANSSGNSFTRVFMGDEDGVGGTDSEDFFTHPDANVFPGDYNGDGQTDLFVKGFGTYRALYLANA
ncbi:trypsin-like serine protease, partial [Xanthovirga aplysinae]|uniref:trypsin-like serine protease n=1 Tax=Xanthovirga aplysinae TaxID=2529853 RepID=UPI0012BC8B97